MCLKLLFLSQDIARSIGESLVLEVDKASSEQIRACTVISDAEKKVQFLLRYVPKLRMGSRNIIEDFEILFVKEVYTKGYKILKDGDFNDGVYFIFEGSCRLLLPLTGHLSVLKTYLPPEDQHKTKYVTVQSLSIKILCQF